MIAQTVVVLAVYALIAYLAYWAGGVWLLAGTVLVIVALSWAAK